MGREKSKNKNNRKKIENNCFIWRKGAKKNKVSMKNLSSYTALQYFFFNFIHFRTFSFNLILP